MNILIAGGGAAGFFAAIEAHQFPGARVLLAEKSRELLAKVSISGGGRCNTTHHCFDPKRHGHALSARRTGAAGAVPSFPLRAHGGVVRRARGGTQGGAGRAHVPGHGQLANHHRLPAPGGAHGGGGAGHAQGAEVRNPRPGAPEIRGHVLRRHHRRVRPPDDRHRGQPQLRRLELRRRALGHTIEEPVPSLFTFHSGDPRPLHGLPGLSAEAEVSVPGTSCSQRGPVLITHWGLSGPAVLKLSGRAARELHGEETTASPCACAGPPNTPRRPCARPSSRRATPTDGPRRPITNWPNSPSGFGNACCNPRASRRTPSGPWSRARASTGWCASC